MINRLLVLFEKMVGKTMLWAGVEVGRKGKPAWQFKVLAGIERERLDENEDKKNE